MKRASSQGSKAIVVDGGMTSEVIEARNVTGTVEPKPGRASIDRLLRPRSVAVVGASATPGSLGANVLLNLEGMGYTGAVYLVNPKRGVIGGRTCLGSVEELPPGVDCAVLAIPGSAVLEAARACARRDVGSLIIFSAGFAESGESGKAAQLQLAAIAREHHMVIEGPNCLGMVNYVDGAPLTFVVSPPQQASDLPGLAIVSQSGALAAVVAVNMREQRIRLSYSISTGNEAAQGVEAFVDHLVGDAHTRVLALVVEQFRSPKRFLEMARRARDAGQFIVLLHPGSSSAARDSAATHTGAMAGNYQVMQTLVAHAGVIHVDSLEEFVDVSQMLVRCPELPRAGAAVFTESGAFKALALDLSEGVGLDLPELSPAAAEKLRSVLPEFIPPSNPLDLTAQGLVDPSLYRRTLPAVLEEDRFGSVLLAIILTDPATAALKFEPIVDAIRSLKPRKPVIFAVMDEGAKFDASPIDELRRLGVACFPSPERALRALARVTQRSVPVEHCSSPGAESLPGLWLEPGVMPEYRSKAVLRELGIPVPDGRIAGTLDAAIGVAGEIGFPIALKAQAADLPHKSDAGGVVLGLKDEEELATGWGELQRNIATSMPGLVLDGVLVERMSEKGLEVILGCRNDPDWGPVLLAGSGGVLAEALHDTILMPPDFSVDGIVRKLMKLKCAPLLRGFRGSPALDVRAAADILVKIGLLVRSAPGIQEIDINPVIVYPEGEGAVALDALIVSADEQSAATNKVSS